MWIAVRMCNCTSLSEKKKKRERNSSRDCFFSTCLFEKSTTTDPFVNNSNFQIHSKWNIVEDHENQVLFDSMRVVYAVTPLANVDAAL